MLRTVRTVIVDEIHAVIGTRRGAHLALSLERLQHVARAAAAADRPVGDAEADRGGRALAVGDTTAGRARSSTRATRGRWISRSRSRGSESRRGDVARGVGRVLRSARGAGAGAPDHAGVREHAAAGRAAGPASERAARRGGASPRITAASRRRSGSMPRRGSRPASSRRWSRPRRSSSASTSATSISSARSARRIASRRCCSGSAAPATPCRARPRAGCSRLARRPARVRRAAARGPPRRARRDRPARRAARRAGAADRRRVGGARRRRRRRKPRCSRWRAARGRTAL